MSSEGKDEAGREVHRCIATGGGVKRLRPILLALSGSLSLHLLLIAVAVSILVSVPQPVKLVRVTLFPGGGLGKVAKAGRGPVEVKAPRSLPHPVSEPKPKRRQRPAHVAVAHRRRRAAARRVAAADPGHAVKQVAPGMASVAGEAKSSKGGTGMGRGTGTGIGDRWGDGADVRGECVYCPAPRYPLIARFRGWQGTVDVGLSVRPDGRVEVARVRRSSGYQALDRAAIEVARISRFSAGPMRGHLRISFVLTDRRDRSDRTDQR